MDRAAKMLESFSMDPSQDRAHCSLGMFPCGNLTTCLPQSLHCNGVDNCENGADEENCVNNVGWPDLLQQMMLSNNSSRNRSGEAPTTCVLDRYPAECRCQGTAICCEDQGLVTVPQVLSSATELDLKKNRISSLVAGQFVTYGSLEKLFLQDNRIVSISRSSFARLGKLQRLYLSYNNITELQPLVFQDLRRLEWLILDHNKITGLLPLVFEGLKSLLFLDLHDNSLRALPNTSICTEMPELNWLDLEGNQFQTLQSSDFQGCSKVTVLILNRNKIEWIQPGTFSPLKQLVELNISYNPLHQIFLDEFDHVPHLRSLNLEGLDIPNIHICMFEKLTNLSHIYFKRFQYCSFAPHVRSCKPNTDGISSFENLLANVVLRFFVWVVAFLTCFGNLFVIFMRSFVVTESSKHTMAIKSLCCADCLMGIYLFFLGAFDLAFSGEYNKHAQAWMASTTCQLVGSLAMLSSEVSVLLLTYMTLEKYLCIVFPFSHYGASKKWTRSILATIWLLGLLLTLLPFLCKESLRKFYGQNGVCFPLHSDGTESQGSRGYSTGIFLGLNLVAFVTIFFAYSSMFYSIHTTAARTAQRSIFSMEVAVAKRFFFIVATNALCWIPIFILKILSLLDMEIPGTTASWVVIFILPINSGLNPILYTLTTTSFQEKLKHCLQANGPLRASRGKSSILLSTHTSTV
ncbi:hypothetical protein lerEdw1_010354 [Lerista edwardsae]|nr:hypothetical protein lerEdw1_010354 [Lerista edwardsae]